MLLLIILKGGFRMSSKRRVFTTNERKALLERYEVSRQTVAEFCRTEGISNAALYQWRTALQGEQKKRRVEKATFVELPQAAERVSPAYEQQPVWAIEVTTKSGTTIRVRG